MAIGHLTRRVALQTPTGTDDGVGGQVDTWTTQDTVWAEIVPIMAGETLTPAGLQAAVSHRVRLHYRSGITSAYRLYDADAAKTYHVRGVRHLDGRTIWTELEVAEVVA